MRRRNRPGRGYDRHKNQQQRFRFREPHSTSSVNMSLLNDYHLYLQQNPSAKTSNLNQCLRYLETAPLSTATHGVSGKLSPMSPARCTTALPAPGSPFYPHQMNNLFSPIPISPMLDDFCSLAKDSMDVYKKVIGDRAMTHVEHSDKPFKYSRYSEGCRSTNYTYFSTTPKLSRMRATSFAVRQRSAQSQVLYQFPKPPPTANRLAGNAPRTSTARIAPI